MISVRLSWGAPAVIRPVRPEDVCLLREMHDRVSPDSLYFRYLRPYKPTFQELDCLHRMNHGNGGAFVAAVEEPREKVVALGIYAVDPQDTAVAEPAILVEDRFQSQGLGRALIRRLASHASENGIQVFDAVIHPANRKAMRLIEQCGLQFVARFTHGALDVRIWLQGSRGGEQDVFAIQHCPVAA